MADWTRRQRIGGGLIKDDTIDGRLRQGRLDARERLVAGYPSKLREQDLGRPSIPWSIPGKLHFMEAEALVRLAGAPPEIAKE